MRTILQSRHLPNLVKASGGPDESPEGHQLMTSVSVPVYKKKDHKVGFPHFFLIFSQPFQDLLSFSKIGQISLGLGMAGGWLDVANHCKSV